MNLRHTRPLAIIALGIALCCSARTEAAVEIAQPGVPVKITYWHIEVQPPPGWAYRLNNNQVEISRDGFLLNSISVTQRKHKKAFPLLKKESSPQSLPEELAEAYVADLKLQPGVRDVIVIDVEPATLAGQPSFRVHLTYRLPPELGGATYEQVTLGAPLPEGLLIARYAAPQINYFAKSLPAFEQTLRTLVVSPKATGEN